MGAADVVPGVSGGTMAYILGIYEQLLAAIKSFDTAWLCMILRLQFRSALARPHFGFIIPLGIGIAVALFTFTRIIPIPRLLQTHPESVYGLFFGLILGSIFILQRQTKLTSPRQFAWLMAGAAIGWTIMTAGVGATPDTPMFALISGMLAICAMILPGISGSFILLILGKYTYIFDALGRLDLAIIIPFGIGAVIGLASFARVLSLVLARWRNTTLLVINGVLAASLWIIWPFQMREYAPAGSGAKLVHSTPFLPTDIDVTVLSSCALALSGLAAVLLIHFMAERR
jgi:putative membrane protein